MTTLTHDIQAVAAVPVKSIRQSPDRAAILPSNLVAQRQRQLTLDVLTVLVQQTDPMEHVNLLAAVLCALQDGGMRVGPLLQLGCVVDCLEVTP